jgi:hypothetical protein
MKSRRPGRQVPLTETITGHADLHLRLMRVGTDGSTMEITIGDWSADSTTSCINEPGGSGGGGGAECAFGSWFPSYSGAVPGGQLLGNLITNADQGVLYSWSTSFCNQYGNCNYQNQLSTVATGGGASTVATGIGAQYQQPIQPMLQRQDGTYVGTVSGNMVAFNSSGQQIWNQPNYSPQVATSDNGVIATSQSGQAVTFDQNGNQSGQMASLLMQSWTANEYQLGSTESIAVPTIDLAASFSPVLGGNPSSPGTAIEPITQDVRAKIAQVALSKLGSQNWLDQQGHNQCNIFVHDVLKESGTTPPESDLTSWKHRSAYYLGLVDSANYPAQAGDWANPTKVLGCWKTLVVPAQPLPPPLPPDISLPGDVIAEAIQYSDATGHVGIIVGSRQTVSADSAVNCYNPPTPAGTITNSDYGFRPDNYVDPTGCRTHGLEEYAVVKRFVCQ